MEEEFRDPLAYVARIRPVSEPYDVYHIVSPSSWSAPKVLHAAALSFPTKRQPIHRLLAHPALVDHATFLLNYTGFLEAKAANAGTLWWGHRWSATRKLPALSDGCLLNLSHLFHLVKQSGGYDGACKGKRCDDVFWLVDDKAPP